MLLIWIWRELTPDLDGPTCLHSVICLCFPKPQSPPQQCVTAMQIFSDSEQSAAPCTADTSVVQLSATESQSLTPSVHHTDGLNDWNYNSKNASHKTKFTFTNEDSKIKNNLQSQNIEFQWHCHIIRISIKNKICHNCKKKKKENKVMALNCWNYSPFL